MQLKPTFGCWAKISHLLMLRANIPGMSWVVFARGRQREEEGKEWTDIPSFSNTVKYMYSYNILSLSLSPFRCGLSRLTVPAECLKAWRCWGKWKHTLRGVAVYSETSSIPWFCSHSLSYTMAQKRVENGTMVSKVLNSTLHQVSYSTLKLHIMSSNDSCQQIQYVTEQILALIPAPLLLFALLDCSFPSSWKRRMTGRGKISEKVMLYLNYKADGVKYCL